MTAGNAHGKVEAASAPSSEASFVLCAVYLDEVGQSTLPEAEVIMASCSHAYLPGCILLWLAVHRACHCSGRIVLSHENWHKVRSSMEQKFPIDELNGPIFAAISKWLCSWLSKSFVVDCFFYLKSLRVQKICFKFLELEFILLNFQKVFWMEKWPKLNCSTRRDIQFRSWQPFHLKSFRTWNFCFKINDFKIYTF
jgi:hypothetical protein